MTAASPSGSAPTRATATLDALDGFCRAALASAGADEPTADAATRAMIHGSYFGVDSHGVRLLEHYVTVLQEGRVNPRPKIKIAGDFGAAAVVEADHAHGALATYKAMEHAVEGANRFGVCGVSIRNSSHFGPAGAYALAAAQAGCIGFVTCNSDSFVRLHNGAAPFHGTNPLAFAAPTGDGRPWLFDMATSAIPYNRVKLSRSLGVKLLPDVASDIQGNDTEDPERAVMLAPLGAAFGYKGAGLAGVAEILSAVLSGMRLSNEIAPMAGPDMSTPRELGAFVLAIRPEAFIGLETFLRGMTRYLDNLRNSPARCGAKVMAPGDREWAEADRRKTQGVPLDPATCESFEKLSRKSGIALPFTSES